MVAQQMSCAFKMAIFILWKFHLHLKKQKSKVQIKSEGFKEASFFQVEIRQFTCPFDVHVALSLWSVADTHALNMGRAVGNSRIRPGFQRTGGTPPPCKVTRNSAPKLQTGS